MAVVAYIICLPINAILGTDLPGTVLVLAGVIAALVCYFNDRIKKETRYFCYGLAVGFIAATVVALLVLFLLASIFSTFHS